MTHKEYRIREIRYGKDTLARNFNGGNCISSVFSKEAAQQLIQHCLVNWEKYRKTFGPAKAGSKPEYIIQERTVTDWE